MDYTTRELEQAYAKLPQELREALNSVELADAITRIGDEYYLHVDDTGELMDEVGLVLLGLHPIQEIKKHIRERLYTTDEVAGFIAQAVDTQIFSKIRGFVTEEFGKQFEKDEAVRETGEREVADPSLPMISPENLPSTISPGAFLTQKLSAPQKIKPAETKVAPKPSLPASGDPYREPLA